MRPYVETLFRHPLLLVVPGILIPVLVAIGAFLTTRNYEVSAALWAHGSSVVVEDRDTSYRAPAATEAQTFRERLDTEAFRDQIITAAGLDSQVADMEWPPSSDLGRLLSKTPLTKPIATVLGLAPPASAEDAHSRALAEINKGITVEAQGDNLVRITYGGNDPEIGVAVVEAAIKVYQEEQVQSSSSQAQAILQFYQDQVSDRKVELDEATAALSSFEALHPEVEGVPRPVSEAEQLAQLQADREVRLSQYEAALQRLNEAELRADTDITGQQYDLVVVDAPTAPDGPTLDVSRALTLVFMGIVFGVGVGGVLLLVRTWSDQTLRRAEDVELRLRVPVLASLPHVGKGN